MTELERYARYSFEEFLTILKGKGIDSLHIQTLSYKGYDIISHSKIGKGVRYFFYKDGRLVKIRHRTFKKNILLYAKNYIDNELLNVE